MCIKFWFEAFRVGLAQTLRASNVPILLSKSALYWVFVLAHLISNVQSVPASEA